MSGDNHNEAQVGAAFATVIAATALPYGYTVSLWCSGALLINAYGSPSVAQILQFAAGAVAAFGLLGLRAHRRAGAVSPRPDYVLVGALHWFAVGAAIGSVALISHIAGWAGWALGSFSATALYLVGTSLEAAIATSLAGPGPR